MILLTDHRIAIAEVPKCGTSWLRRAVEILKVPHAFDPQPVLEACPRHSPPGFYNLTDYRILVTVREPAAWAQSFWQHTCWWTAEHWEPGRIYTYRHLAPETGEPFPAWLRRVVLPSPGCVSKYFREFTKAAAGVLRQGHLEEDLSRAIGVPVTHIRQSVAMQNVSRPCVFDWGGHREQFVTKERWLTDLAETGVL